MKKLKAIALKTALWAAFYLVGFLHFHWVWLVFLAVTVFVVQQRLFQQPNRRLGQKDADMSTVSPKDSRSDLPAWVVHPDMQRTEWLNVIIKQMWPYLEGFLEMVLKSVEEDTNLRSRLAGYHVHSIRFPRASLGKIPPRFGGIKFYRATHRDEIILDMDVTYAGDMVISMEVCVLNDKIPTIKASLSKLTLTSTQLRLHLRPLLVEKPFVGAVTLSFLNTPDLDFDLGGLANALDFPGISLLLRHIVQDQLEQTMVMPNSYTIRLLPEDELQDLLDKRINSRGEASPLSLPKGVLNVHLVEAKNLVNRDFSLMGGKKSDPYAIVSLEVDNSRHSYKTDVKEDCLNPEWKMLLDLPVDDPDSVQDIVFEVWDKDHVTSDDFLGRCVIPAQQLRSTIHNKGQLQDIWKVLEDVKSGTLHVEIGWSELKMSPSGGLGMDNSHLGVVSLFIDSCMNLSPSGKTGLKLPNPKVRVEVCNVFQTTETVVGSVDPVFEHRMNFLVGNPNVDRVKIQVIDNRSNDQIIGRLELPISELLDNRDLTAVNVPYDLKTHLASSAQIRLSMTFRYIHRPVSRGFGTHKGLEDLTKIIPSPPASIVNVAHEEENGEKTIQPLLKEAEPEKEETLEDGGNSASLKHSATMPKNLKVMKEDESSRMQVSLKYCLRTAKLSVTIHRIRYRPQMENGSTYVKLRLIESIMPGRNCRVSHTKRKTTSQKSGLHPVFEETICYLITPHELKMRRLETTICQEGRFLGRNEVLSRCIISLEPIQLSVARGEENPTHTDWYPLPRSLGRSSSYTNMAAQ